MERTKKEVKDFTQKKMDKYWENKDTIKEMGFLKACVKRTKEFFKKNK